MTRFFPYDIFCPVLPWRQSSRIKSHKPLFFSSQDTEEHFLISLSHLPRDALLGPANSLARDSTPSRSSSVRCCLWNHIGLAAFCNPLGHCSRGGRRHASAFLLQYLSVNVLSTNLSNPILNLLTLSASTTSCGKQIQKFTVCSVKRATPI